MRSLALGRMQKESPPATPRSAAGWSSWVPGWGWGYYTAPGEVPPEVPEEQPVDYSLFFDKDSVFGKVSAELLHGSVQLLEYDSAGNHRPLVQFTFGDLAVGAEYRMKTDTIILSASLQVHGTRAARHVLNKLTANNSNRLQLVRSSVDPLRC